MDSEEIRHELPGAYEFRKARWAALVFVLAFLVGALLPDLMEPTTFISAVALIAAVVYGAIGFHLRGRNHY